MQLLFTFLSPFLTLLRQPKTHQATEQIHHLHLRRSSSVAGLSLTAINKKVYLHSLSILFQFQVHYTSVLLYNYAFMINIQSGYMYNNYTHSANWANILRVARSLHAYDEDVILR